MSEPRPATIVMRHHKENLRKCSLRGIGGRSEVRMLTYPRHTLPDVNGYLWLTLDAEPLSPADAGLPLLLIDATWRHAARMCSALQKPLATTLPRSIPADFVTAYPRRQTECPDPQRGLASIEALYIAYRILCRDPAGLLDNYLWADAFLETNAALLRDL